MELHLCIVVLVKCQNWICFLGMDLLDRDNQKCIGQFANIIINTMNINENKIKYYRPERFYSALLTLYSGKSPTEVKGNFVVGKSY